MAPIDSAPPVLPVASDASVCCFPPCAQPWLAFGQKPEMRQRSEAGGGGPFVLHNVVDDLTSAFRNSQAGRGGEVMSGMWDAFHGPCCVVISKQSVALRGILMDINYTAMVGAGHNGRGGMRLRGLRRREPVQRTLFLPPAIPHAAPRCISRCQQIRTGNRHQSQPQSIMLDGKSGSPATLSSRS